jgi:hypothetical protein
MGWYINYEIIFEEPVSWDDNKVLRALKDIDCHFLYLRNYEMPVCIFSLYMKHDIKELAHVLTHFFDTQLKYKLYGTDEWTLYKEKKN